MYDFIIIHIIILCYYLKYINIYIYIYITSIYIDIYIIKITDKMIRRILFISTSLYILVKTELKIYNNR